MHIRHATLADAQAIIIIANTTWPVTYSTIISQEQITFMLNAFYSKAVIEEQLKDASQYFFIAEENNEVLGYAHIVPYSQLNRTYKLSKLYILPAAQGKQIGKMLMQYTEQFLISNKIQTMLLNVNRNNPAIDFYKKMKYQIIETVDIPLDKFWLNDYIMKKDLATYSL
jgi:ribosomal protein S18 acetylase RimI-like enzyme